MHLRYYAPYYEKETHEKILNYLEDIKRLHNINYEEIPIGHWFPEWYSREAKISEAYVYDNHLKPYSSLILFNCNKLLQMGLDLHCDTVSSKFKSRSGNIYVAGTIAVVENGVTLLALADKDEIFEFLKALLREGWNLLNMLEKTKPKTIVEPREREKEIKRALILALSKNFDYVLMDVKLNALSGDEWDPFIYFSPDADIIA